MLENSESKIVTFESNDHQANLSMYFFKSLQFEFSGMASKPTSYHYEKAKDYIVWTGFKPKNYISLLDEMFSEFVRCLPTK